MPELPEVETVKNVLLPIVKGHTITTIDVLRRTTIQGDVDDFISNLQHQKFLDVTRIGKYLIFHLTNDKVILSHLRMEGKYYEFSEKDDNSKYAKVVFHLDNGHKLCYDDSRCFGILKLSSESDYLKDEMIAKLGPEPFKANAKEIYKRTKSLKKPIKNVLLDQSIMTGLGNIYVDETLFASKIHPLTPANKLGLKDWESIIEHARNILNDAINQGGSTIKSYHPGKDIDGNFQTRLKIYGKAGELCDCCKEHEYRFIKVGGRGTTYCPHCQKKIGAPIYVGITGKISSGKSTILNIFKDNNIPTISSDEVVKELYKQEKVANDIEKLLGIKFPLKEVDKDILRNHLLINPKDKKKVERYIHPLVKKEILNFFSKGNEPIKAAEVPLLFEAKFDSLFDVIIVSDIDEKKQSELINARDKQKAIYLKEINKTNKIDENKNKASYLVLNNGSIKELNSKVNKIITELKGLAK